MKKILITLTVGTVSTAAMTGVILLKVVKDPNKIADKVFIEYLKQSNDIYDIRCQLVKDTLSGRFTSEEVMKIIEKFTSYFKEYAPYGTPNNFTYSHRSYSAPEKPWSKDTIEALDNLSCAGEYSIEYLLSTAEIAKYVKKKRD